MESSARKLLDLRPGLQEDIEHFFFASDSTQHFIDALPNQAIMMSTKLGLSKNVQQQHLSLMGCCGGLQALRVCINALKAESGKHALVQVFEATGTQNSAREQDIDKHDLLQMLLFGDGVATAWVASGPLSTEDRHIRRLKVLSCKSEIVPGTYDLLRHQNHWDHVYTTIGTELPTAIKDAVPPFVYGMLGEHIKVGDVAFLVHPGGPKVLESMRDAFGLKKTQLEHSWNVLSNHGNMSGATNLAVMRDFMAGDGFKEFRWALAIAFGPGICVQAILFEVIQSEEK